MVGVCLAEVQNSVCNNSKPGHGWTGLKENRTKALQNMRAAAKEESLYGVESQTVPAYEMLGYLLLELHHPRPALVAYAVALREAST